MNFPFPIDEIGKVTYRLNKMAEELKTIARQAVLGYDKISTRDFADDENFYKNHLNIEYVSNFSDGSAYTPENKDRASREKFLDMLILTCNPYEGLRYSVRHGFMNGISYFSKRVDDFREAAMEAMKYDQTMMVEYLIDNGRDKRIDDEYIEHLLLIAASYGNAHAVSMCIDRGARDTGRALLHAVSRDQVNVVKYIVENHNVGVETALKRASAIGSMETLRYFLEYDLNLEIKTKMAMSAIKHIKIDVVVLLIEKGFDVVNMLYISIYFDNLDICRFLLKNFRFDTDVLDDAARYATSRESNAVSLFTNLH